MRCPHCKERIVYPVLKPKSELNNTFWKRIIWRNALRVQWQTVVILLLVIYGSWAFEHDVGVYKSFYEGYSTLEGQKQVCDQICVAGCIVLNRSVEGLLDEKGYVSPKVSFENESTS